MWQVAFIKILEEEATDCLKSDFVSIKVTRNHQFPLLPAKKDRSQKKKRGKIGLWNCQRRHLRVTADGSNSSLSFPTSLPLRQVKKLPLIKHGGGNQRRQGESNQPSVFWPAANYEKHSMIMRLNHSWQSGFVSVCHLLQKIQDGNFGGY